MALSQDHPRLPTRRRYDSLQQQAFLELWKTYDRLKALETELFALYDLTAQQYTAMRVLRGCHPNSMPTLAVAARLVTQAPDITRLLDKLALRNLIQRERLPENRRVVQVGITEQGLGLLDELDEPVRECHRRQLGHLSQEQLKQLTTLLEAARAPHEEPPLS